MKNVNDFLSESDKDKAKANKAKREEKPHAITREMEFPEDKLYFALMDQYKHLRRTDREKAKKLLEKAQKLSQGGKVSKDAILGAAYL